MRREKEKVRGFGMGAWPVLFAFLLLLPPPERASAIPPASSESRLDTDGDGLTDSDEQTGRAAWEVEIQTNQLGWVEFDSSAQWVTRWPIRHVRAGRLSRSVSPPLPAALSLGARSSKAIRISTDGLIWLGSGEPPTPLKLGVNLPLSTPGLSGLVAVFWDELSVSFSRGVWVRTEGVGEGARTVVTWTGVRQERNPEEGLDFQLDYSAATRAYTFRYRAVPDLVFPVRALSTVGLRGPGTSCVARVVFNRAGVICPGMTVCLRPAITSPDRADTDGDGFTDGEEACRGWNPVRAEDGSADADGDGVAFADEIRLGTDPMKADTDGDGFTDGEEVAVNMNPLNPADSTEDFDGDGLCNDEEWCYGTDLHLADTDGDGVSDHREVVQGSDPTDAADGGKNPSAKMFAQVRMDPGAGPVGAWGAVFQLGKYRLRGRVFKGREQWAHCMMARGRSYTLDVYNREGFVEPPALTTDLRVDLESPVESTADNDRWFCSTAAVDAPGQVFGSWKR
jgi:hypothetical protein